MSCQHEWGKTTWHKTQSYGTRRCLLCEQDGYASWEGRVSCRSVEELKAQKLCRWCSTPLEGRRTAYCSEACSLEFDRNHFWGTAARAALKRAEYQCRTCGSSAVRHPYANLEVNHIQPLKGAFRSISCLNHQENLEVLCHDCHAIVTAQQARERSRAGKAAKRQEILL